MVKVKRNIITLIWLDIIICISLCFIPWAYTFFFSIPIESHNVFKSKLVQINLFLDDTNNFLANADTLLPNCRVPSSPHMAILTPFEIVDPLPLHTYQYLHKSIWLPDFVYSSYSDSFTSFLPSIDNLSEPLSYRQTILDPLW